MRVTICPYIKYARNYICVLENARHPPNSIFTFGFHSYVTMEQINVDGFDPDVCVIIPPEKCDRRSVEDLMLQNLGVNCRVEGEELFNFVKNCGLFNPI